jgi:TRAP-type transport system small permease protein
MRLILRNLYDMALNALKILIVIMATALVIIVFSNVIFRYFLNSALAWSEEAARFLFIWLSFMGAVLANAKSEHMNFDMIVKHVPKKVGAILSIVANMIIISILILIIKGSITIVLGSITWMTSALEIPYGYVYSIVPVCSLILALQFLTRLIKNVISLFDFKTRNLRKKV